MLHAASECQQAEDPSRITQHRPKPIRHAGLASRHYGHWFSVSGDGVNQAPRLEADLLPVKTASLVQLRGLSKKRRFSDSPLAKGHVKNGDSGIPPGKQWCQPPLLPFLHQTDDFQGHWRMMSKLQSLKLLLFSSTFPKPTGNSMPISSIITTAAAL